MNISFSDNVKQHWILSKDYYSFQSINRFLTFFFQDSISSINIIKNIKIYGIQDEVNDINKDDLNILICVENCSHFKHYNHYNKYGNYGDEKIKIYFYNHIDKMIVTNKYISIPIIYTQISYFNKYYQEIKPTIEIPFNKKKFCLFVSNNNHRNDIKNKIKYFLQNIEPCDNLEIYKPILHYKSCYHSVEFMNILQQYKFVFVCENSLADGYITEKIFNCFFSRCIPIYNGCKNVESYFNKNSFININIIDNFNKINLIKDNENLFNEFINANKINNNFNDENYREKLTTFIIEQQQH